VVFVTHDPFIARHTNRVIRLEDGKVVGDERVINPLIAGTAHRTEDF
jgi:ABC-type lipoprotein export system ATPase subunit